MFGDFEAQRHWMEITVNLPVKEWYKNSTHNDLQYWGLDYPPLTAYHSYLCGSIASRINSSWMQLNTSRGSEQPQLKQFMRNTVLSADVLLYIPAVYVFFDSLKSPSVELKEKSLLAMLLYPGLILIDHGHFQYNCISLGLALWAVVFICRGHDLLGSISFVLALNYKQMELYHAMPFFCYLLGSAFNGKENWFFKLCKIGFVVVTSFILCWFPFLWAKEDSVQVLHRIFPFARGLFEDKVASFWCSLSIVIKLKQVFDIATLTKICLVTTFVGLIPSSLHLLLNPKISCFIYALANSSLVFFLFSFQVHEKSILLAALPISLLFPRHPVLSLWFSIISTFSMLPLLVRDGLFVPFAALSVAYIVLLACSASKSHPLMKFSISVSLLGAFLLSACLMLVRPPAHLPDLFPVLISSFSCAHFMPFLFYLHYLQLNQPSNKHEYNFSL